MLLVGAGLMILAGGVFVFTRNFFLLLAAATIGVISPSGNEVGPFLSIEQAALSQLLPGERRTGVFAWYNLAGSFATASGALAGGGLTQALQGVGLAPLRSYQVIILGYALFGLALWGLFTRLSPEVEIIARTCLSAGASPVIHGSPRLAGSGLQAGRVVLPGRFRRGLYHPKPSSLLVPSTLWVGTRTAGGDIFRRQHPGRPLGAQRGAGSPAASG